MNPKPQFKPTASSPRRILTLALLALLTIIHPPSTLFAQGSLTPPGAPAPTMKSLDIIEARTPISAVPYMISSPGSYYLTANLNVTAGDAITITANGVTLDLNGFTLSSTDPNNTGSGIVLGGSGRRQNISILNGFITGSVGYGGGFFGSGFASGVLYVGPAPYNIRVAGVSVSGCLLYGIYLNIGVLTVVESCAVQTVGGYGIVAATVSHSAAYLCGDTAILANVASDCYGYCTGSGNVLRAETANNCRGQSSSGGGLYASSTATGCYGASNTGDGLYAPFAIGCYGSSNTGEGFYGGIANNCVGVSSGGGNGLYATGAASNCYGSATGSGVGLVTNLAIGCSANNPSGLALSAYIANSCYADSIDSLHKYNMP